MGRATFWAIFSQTHPITLLGPSLLLTNFASWFISFGHKIEKKIPKKQL
jgi:hypothetical protein